MSKEHRRFRDITQRQVDDYMKPSHDVNKAFFAIAETEHGKVIEQYFQDVLESFVPNPLDARAWAIHEANRRIAAEILQLMRKDPHEGSRDGNEGR